MTPITDTIREKHAKYHLDHGRPADILVLDWNSFLKFEKECYDVFDVFERGEILGKRNFLGMKIYQISGYADETIIIASCISDA